MLELLIGIVVTLAVGVFIVKGYRPSLACMCIDTWVCAWAMWLLSMCEVQGVHIVNGGSHTAPMPFTFSRG